MKSFDAMKVWLITAGTSGIFAALPIFQGVVVPLYGSVLTLERNQNIATVDLSWSDDEVKVGDTVTLEITIKNDTKEMLPLDFMRVQVPDGMMQKASIDKSDSILSVIPPLVPHGFVATKKVKMFQNNEVITVTAPTKKEIQNKTKNFSVLSPVVDNWEVSEVGYATIHHAFEATEAGEYCMHIQENVACVRVLSDAKIVQNSQGIGVNNESFNPLNFTLGDGSPVECSVINTQKTEMQNVYTTLSDCHNAILEISGDAKSIAENRTYIIPKSVQEVRIMSDITPREGVTLGFIFAQDVVISKDVRRIEAVMQMPKNTMTLEQGTLPMPLYGALNADQIILGRELYVRPSTEIQKNPPPLFAQGTSINTSQQ